MFFFRASRVLLLNFSTILESSVQKFSTILEHKEQSSKARRRTPNNSGIEYIVDKPQMSTMRFFIALSLIGSSIAQQPYVLLCLGQSNMAWPVSKSAHAKETLAAANQLGDRLVSYDENMRRVPFKSTSAVCLNAALELNNHNATMINLAVGGSRIEEWTAPDGYLYKTKLAKVAHLDVDNVLWYQGESNTVNYMEYADLSVHFFKQLRGYYPRADIHLVELAGYRSKSTALDGTTGVTITAELRAAQRESAARLSPYVHTVSAIDLGNRRNVHPKNKRDVGKRLAMSIRGQYDEPVVTGFTNGNTVTFSEPVMVRKWKKRQKTSAIEYFDGRAWRATRITRIVGNTVTIVPSKRPRKGTPPITKIRVMWTSWVQSPILSVRLPHVPVVPFE